MTAYSDNNVGRAAYSPEVRTACSFEGETFPITEAESDFARRTATSWVFFAGNAKPSSMRRAIAERLAEAEPVVIVDRPVSVLRDRQLPPLESRLAQLGNTGQSWRLRPLHLPERIPLAGRTLRAANRRRLVRELSRLLPPDARRIVCYDSPAQADLAGRLGEDRSIYLAIDDRTVTVCGEPIKGELEAERCLLERVQKVICVSEPLAQALRERMPPGRTGSSIEVLPNGYDERLFDPDEIRTEPDLLRGMPRPRVLVAGHVSERIDWDGIGSAMRLRPGWTWIFVGPADPGMPERISEIAGRLNDSGARSKAPRAIWHESVLIDQVPGLIAHCDVCAVPYRLNSFTLASCPLKAIEYLAMGAPVISTRIPSLRRYEGVIKWIAEGDGMSYALALDSTLSTRNGGQDLADLRDSVRRDSWKWRTEQFRTCSLGPIHE